MTTQTKQADTIDPPATSLERAQRAVIKYPRFQTLHGKIKRCRELSKISGEPQCMSLTGVTGAGKSTLVKSYAAAFPRKQTKWGTEIPVFYFATPSPVTEKGMASTMLESLGDPAAFTGTQWQMNSRLRHYLKECKVELVILDDFQHLLDKKRKKVLESVSEWLKALIKQAEIPFLVVGIEGEVDPILACNAQLSRLFACREQLPPFDCVTKDLQIDKDFAWFVQFAEEAVALPLPAELPRVELLYRLHYATNGVVGNLMNLLREAGLAAREKGRKKLDLTMLSLAFTQRLAKHLPGKVNPFEVAADARFIAPKMKDIDAAKYAGESPSELLKAS